MSYRAPLDDIRLALAATGAVDADPDLTASVLEGAARFAEDVLAPLDRVGDQHPAKLVGDKVLTSPGWEKAYQAFVEGGWPALSGPEEFGGQGLPHVLASSVIEIWSSANLAFGLCPLLTQGAVDALRAAASPELKAALSAQDGVGRVDRHHEPHRAPRRHRPRRSENPRRSPSRRQLSGSSAPRSTSPTATTN